MKIQQLYTTVILGIVFSFSLFGNGIVVSNISVTQNDIANQKMEITFDVAWNNSWRTDTLESNYDAAWLFIKYKVEGSANSYKLEHGTLKATGHTIPTGAELNVANGLQGAMIYRDAPGIGNVSFTGVTLVWDYGADGLQGFEGLDVHIIATEMVFVPGGAFYAGDGSTSTNGRLGDATGDSYLVSSENAVTLGGGGTGAIHSFWNNTSNDDFDVTQAQTLPADFPKGFDPFYIMKYEISVDQYITFLNATRENNNLSPYYFGGLNFNPPQIDAAIENDPLTEYEISITSGCGNVQYDQINFSKLVDFYGMRPMSELEYEKASRGTLPSVQGEYVWGTQFINTTEAVSEDFGNALFINLYNAHYYFDGSCPTYDIGDFARLATTKSRELTGSTYYGIMEMSGSMTEPVVGIGTATKRTFTRNMHGDGDLLTAYDLTNLIGVKGGGFSDFVSSITLSGRGTVNFNSPSSFALSGRMVISDFNF